MDGKKDKAQKGGKSAGWLDMVTGKTGKIVASIAVLVGLLTQVGNIVEGVQKIPKTWNAVIGVSETDCFRAVMHVQPLEVRVEEWYTAVRFQLKGKNECRQKLEAHVAYKAQGESVRIEPPFPSSESCASFATAGCWESSSLDRGQDVNWVLTPPRLTQLSQLTKPVRIVINWIVFNTDTGKQIRAGRAEITVTAGS